VPPIDVHVVHNAVDLRAFAPDGPSDDLDERAGLARPSVPTVRIGLVATFARWKGHETFLRAIAALPRDLALRAYVIGEPLYDTAGSQHTLAELRACAAGLGIADRVGFTGFLRAPYAMRALDVVVHASTRPEPFGLVIAEAMACGRAVVTSATGGAREIVQPGIDAIVHTPGDAASLCDAIARLATDSALRRELGAHARASACVKFDPDRLASETIAVYEQLT
jgi:glycosyltransferase involved in cell wall biosynthesis